MGLDPSTEKYQGRSVAVRPVYGWGWSRLDAPEIPVPAQSNGVPYPFHCRVQHFFHFQNELRGAVAVIEEPGHIYDGLWIVVSTRLMGTHDFVRNLPYCDIQIGAEAPVGDWPEFLSDSPLVNGYCFVGETLRHIEQGDSTMRRKTTAFLDIILSDQAFHPTTVAPEPETQSSLPKCS